MYFSSFSSFELQKNIIPQRSVARSLNQTKQMNTKNCKKQLKDKFYLSNAKCEKIERNEK